jgi:carotenoid cleavage dioxygenase-like enzyme
MMFPDQPLFRGPLRPQRMECEIIELECEGEIPAVLEGAFYRCGPDPLFPPRAGTDIGINGDGYVSQFLFDRGHVDFRLRFVRTEKFKAERHARRALFGSYRNPFTDEDVVSGLDRTTANTSVIWYDRRLLALKEDGLPHELDPFTLETLGKFNFHGSLRTPTVTAHPKIDPASRKMFFYGFESAGLATPDVALCVGDSEGRLLHEEWFVPPYGALIHDFAMTENFVIFPIMPTTANIERMRAGGDHWAWDPSQPMYLGIVPKALGACAIRYFRGPARWSFHTMNAFEHGSLVYLDTTAAHSNGFFRHIDGNPPDSEKGEFRLTRWTCDLASPEDCFTEVQLNDLPSDFYTVDSRFVGKAYRYGFMAVKDPSRPVNGIGNPRPFNSIGRIDVRSGEVNLWYAGEESSVQEPVFVQKSPDAPEGLGYLLAVVNRHAEHRSEVVILDAEALDRGPVARMFVPLNLRMAFHGTFVPAAALRHARARTG